MTIDASRVELVSTYSDDRDRRQQAPPAAPAEQDDQSLAARVQRAKAGKTAIRAKATEVRASMTRSGRV